MLSISGYNIFVGVISICKGWNFRMKEKKTQKKIQISIRAKILVGMVVCTLIVANLSGWFLMNQAKTMLLEQCKQNARKLCQNRSTENRWGSVGAAAGR